VSFEVKLERHHRSEIKVPLGGEEPAAGSHQLRASLCFDIVFWFGSEVETSLIYDHLSDALLIKDKRPVLDHSFEPALVGNL